MSKNILKGIIIFLIGAIGGVFADQILWPYFIERPLFYQYGLEQAPIHLTETNEITIEENSVLQNAVEKIEKSVVGIRTITSGGKIIQGSGLVITSDGLVLTLAEIIPQGARFNFFIDGKAPQFQVLKRDLKNNLALIKVEEVNLTTIGFAELGSLRYGQRVFLLAALLKNGDLRKTVNQGIIKTYDKEFIQTNILEENKTKGSPLFNIKGELVGLNTLNSKGEIVSIPISKIHDFLGF